ncbi:MAG: gamma-glutamyl-gamma-aminobutyrate hydrolase family protein [Candidatus Kapabacteria bacterium]|nr:gamma-glutamyl-gamma-aminobutyrate hydrolase family protein [Candidatus Kapabacteria bacterium]
MIIALSKANGTTPAQIAKYALYTSWLQAANPQVTTVDCSMMEIEEAYAVLERCQGFVLTGGADVHPARYGKPGDAERCHLELERDELEFALVQRAHEMNLPMLGICRGFQVLNVAFGGSLIVDIPTDTQTTIEHRAMNGTDSIHDIEVESGSILAKVSRTFEGSVNSAHHQGIDVLSQYFREAARSSDGLIEAIEVAEPTGGNPFILAVQWHPERMDWNSPYSLPIAHQFLFECDAYSTLLQGRPYVSLVPPKPDQPGETGTLLPILQ